MKQERIAADFALQQMNQRLVKANEELQEVVLLVKNPKTAKSVRTKREAVELGLKTLIRIEKQSEFRKYRGKLLWEGDLEIMRSDS